MREIVALSRAGKYQKVVSASPPHFHNGGKQKAKFQMTLQAFSITPLITMRGGQSWQ
jgi:hypothetical protein